MSRLPGVGSRPRRGPRGLGAAFARGARRGGPRAAARRGQVLGYAALLLVALVGVAALVIDLGIVYLTRQQMQSAAELAALEGLRWRDELPVEWLADPATLAQIEALAGGPHPPLPQDDSSAWRAWRDAARRWAAARAVRLRFDDNLNPDDGDAMNFGAGPNVSYSGGTPVAPQFNAGQTIAPAAAYKPALEPNPTNAPAGDLVAGNYTEPAVAGGHAEAADYARADFQPSTAGDALLARLRRSDEAAPPGASRGDPVPTLWARGVLARAETRFDGTPVAETALYDRKARGLVVRAAAIARGEPAVVVGQADAARELAGLGPWAMEQAAWDAWPVDAAQTLAVAGSGRLSDSTGNVGQLIPCGSLKTSAAPLAVGHALTQTATQADLAGVAFPDPAVEHVAAIVTGAPGSYVVVGFGYVEVTGNSTGLSMVKRDGRVLPRNASAAWPPGLPPQGLAAAWNDHRTLDAPLLAPALRRAVDVP